MKIVLIKPEKNNIFFYKNINRYINKLIFIVLILSVSLNLFFFFTNKYGFVEYSLEPNKNISFFYYKKFEHYLINGRITAFINADHIYISYIPIFCASLLYSDKRNKTDIEIIIDINKLPHNIEIALDYLRAVYFNSKIVIRYNKYKTFSTYAILNDKKVKKDSVRWLVEPIIKNEYIFIGDIDIIYLVDNYYDNYLIDMLNRSSCYSNIVRPNSTRLSGVHFSKWYCLYPIILPKKFDFMMHNEKLILQRLKLLGVNIDYQTNYRPIFGIHMSVNRPSVTNKVGIPTWEAKGKKILWKKFTGSDVYKYIYPLLDKFIINKIILLEEYYKENE